MYKPQKPITWHAMLALQVSKPNDFPWCLLRHHQSIGVFLRCGLCNHLRLSARAINRTATARSRTALCRRSMTGESIIDCLSWSRGVSWCNRKWEGVVNDCCLVCESYLPAKWSHSYCFLSSLCMSQSILLAKTFDSLSSKTVQFS